MCHSGSVWGEQVRNGDNPCVLSHGSSYKVANQQRIYEVPYESKAVYTQECIAYILYV